MSGPWGAIISAIASNMQRSGQNAQTSEQQGEGGTNRQPGQVYGSAPNMGNTAQSPTGQITQVTGLPVAFQKQQPIVGQALKGEEAMLRNVSPAVGSYTQAPTTVDSSQRPYDSRNMWGNLYSQYMRY